MTSLLDAVLDFCDGFPIVSIVAIIICIACLIPPLMLLIAIQRAAVHDNCRFLISLWSICLCAILLNIATIYGHTFTFTKGFLPRGVGNSYARACLFWVHGTLYFFSSSLEMFMVVERMFSTRQPHVYHESGRATWTIVLAAVIAFGLGLVNDYFLYMKGPLTLGIVVHNVLDLLTLIVNRLCIRYSKGRFEALYGKASLNARYQIKEAFSMAKAMEPVYVASLLFKVSGTAIGYIYTLFICCSDDRHYVFIDVAYLGVHIVNCVFSASFLIYKHASIRKAARALFSKEREANDVVNGKSTHETANAYFSMLVHSWK